MTFGRITVRAEQMGGVPCIRSLRIPVVNALSPRLAEQLRAAGHVVVFEPRRIRIRRIPRGG